MIDELVVHVRDGAIADDESWIYAWLQVGASRPVIYVGATGLHPAVRTWLHLHDDDPDVGRVASRYLGARDEPLDVVALRLPPQAPRQAAKQAAIAALARRNLLADSYFGDAADSTGTCDEQGERLAALVAART